MTECHLSGCFQHGGDVRAHLLGDQAARADLPCQILYVAAASEQSVDGGQITSKRVA
jgi:hypothetical protein